MTSCHHSNSRIQRLLYLLLVVDGALAFPSFVVRYADDSHQHHFRLPAFLSNSDAAHGVPVHASSSSSKQLFAVAKATGGNKFRPYADDDNGDSDGSVSEESGIVLSGTPNRTYYFLKDEVGLSKKGMEKVMRTDNRCGQSVLRFEASNLGYKIETLRKIMNLTDNEVCTIIEKFPNVLGYSADNNIAPALLILEELLELNQTDLRKLVLRSPWILGTNATTLQSKIDFVLHDLNLSLPKLRKMLLKYSIPLMYSLKKMQGTIGYLRHEVRLTDEVLKRVVGRQPQVLGLQVRNLNGNVEFLRGAFSLTNKQLRQVLAKQPSLVGYSIENNLQPKVEYLREHFGGNDQLLRNAVLSLPALLGYSLDKRIRPRLEAILEAGFDPSILTIGIPMKEEDFDGWLQRKIDKREKKKNDPLW